MPNLIGRWIVEITTRAQAVTSREEVIRSFATHERRCRTFRGAQMLAATYLPGVKAGEGRVVANVLIRDALRGTVRLALRQG